MFHNTLKDTQCYHQAAPRIGNKVLYNETGKDPEWLVCVNTGQHERWINVPKGARVKLVFRKGYEIGVGKVIKYTVGIIEPNGEFNNKESFIYAWEYFKTLFPDLAVYLIYSNVVQRQILP